MVAPRFLLVAFLLSAFPVVAQFPVGFRDAGIQNTTSSGSRNLGVRVYYPATKTGRDAPLRKQSGGYPVVVVLHGLGGRAINYTLIGETLAVAGIIAVLNDTAQFNPDLQVRDGIALYASLVAENRKATSFFRGALDMNRAGICGHSMGGGSTVRTLAADPGYKAGFCFAPWDGTFRGQGNSWTASAPSVKVPLAILHGEGDNVVPWQAIGLVFYNKANRFTGLKAFILLDRTATHNNVVRLPGNPSAGDRAVLARGMAMVVGWFDRHLRGGVTGLEDVVGSVVRKDPNLKSIMTEYRTPALWRFGSLKIGGNGSFSLGGEPGNGAIYLSSGTKKSLLPFGTLLLDPVVILPLVRGTIATTRLVVVPAAVPNDASLVGAQVWFQGITDGGAPGLQLTNVVPVVITK